MLRERLDEYLDDALDPAQRQEVEDALATDAAAAALLTRLKAERAHRAATFATYLPTSHEAKALAERMLAQAYDAPVGRIGYWVRRGAAVAAAIAIVAGTFFVGRMSVAPQTVSVTEYDVAWVDGGGLQQVRSFASMEERNKFIQQLDQTGVTGIAVADIMAPGHL